MLSVNAIWACGVVIAFDGRVALGLVANDLTKWSNLHMKTCGGCQTFACLTWLTIRGTLIEPTILVGSYPTGPTKNLLISRTRNNHGQFPDGLLTRCLTFGFTKLTDISRRVQRTVTLESSQMTQETHIFSVLVNC